MSRYSVRARRLNQQALSAFLWSVADLLRGDYKQSDYGKVILPLTVLRRIDCVLAPTKEAVLAEHAARTAQGMNPEPFLTRKAGQSFYNTSPLDMKKLMGDQDNIAANLYSYIQAFSPEVRDIFDRFEFSARSTACPSPACSTRSSRSSPRSTCIPSRSTTTRWAWCSRS